MAKTPQTPEQMAAPAAPSPPPPGDNAKKGLAGLSRADRTKLRLNHIALMRPLIAQIDEVEAVKKALGKQLTKLRNDYKGDGFLLGNLDEMFKSEKMPRRDTQKREQDRHELMEDTGQVVYVQQDFIDKMPEEARDEQYWKEAGYALGIQGKELKHPSEMPERFFQALAKGWHSAQETMAWAVAGTVNPERRPSDVGITPIEGAGKPGADDEDDGDEEIEGEKAPEVDPLLN